jgi:hypothetical protein
LIIFLGREKQRMKKIEPQSAQRPLSFFQVIDNLIFMFLLSALCGLGSGLIIS